jgi:glyoxalase family protein
MSTHTITGIHHITAIAGDPQRNLDFYTDVLGLRLVKLTINFDDPGTYHFYFGDAHGSPGSILTFFPWAGARRGTVGDGQVSAVTFAVPAKSIPYWQERLERYQIPMQESHLRFGETVLPFIDPDGLPLELIASDRADDGAVWARPVEAGHAIRGFHSATLSEEGYEYTAALLVDVMHFSLVGQEGNRFRFQTPSAGPGSIVDVVCTPDAPSGRLGTGTVHHLAWRTPDDAQQQRWRDVLVRDHFNVSPIMDRTYFHSIYYREPGGVLFEIATDPPGFTVDEPLDHLGEHLKLPPHVEPHRATLEPGLPRLVLPHQR